MQSRPNVCMLHCPLYWKIIIKILDKNYIILMISLSHDNRGNPKGNTEFDGLIWIDHFSCEKSSVGSCTLQAFLLNLANGFSMKEGISR
ncbi:hypothetical protein CIPAW_06G072900 [Carya illinoinensis]|uniref:Uncharacterized protein n=1 Tax=Carya illinoinensis TaxID=32201 RepID=A0A8T1Q8U3_CARIL|nr:hypothetical protein CIPAW_06G072900 [Carya illinoinensis]